MALEGDGSALAGLGVLSTIGRYAPPNLVVVIFHNGVYASCGDGRSRRRPPRLDLRRSPACGIRPQNVVAVATLAEARKALSAALTEPGPWVVVAHIEQPDRWPAGRLLPRHDLVETAVAFAGDDGPGLPLGRPGLVGTRRRLALALVPPVRPPKYRSRQREWNLA